VNAVIAFVALSIAASRSSADIPSLLSNRAMIRRRRSIVVPMVVRWGNDGENEATVARIDAKHRLKVRVRFILYSIIMIGIKKIVEVESSQENYREDVIWTIKDPSRSPPSSASHRHRSRSSCARDLSHDDRSSF